MKVSRSVLIVQSLLLCSQAQSSQLLDPSAFGEHAEDKAQALPDPADPDPDPAEVLLCDGDEPEVDDEAPWPLEVGCWSRLVELDPEPLAVPPLALCF